MRSKNLAVRSGRRRVFARPRRPSALAPLRVLLLAIAMLLGNASGASAWWNGDWAYRMKVNADAGPTGAAITEPIGRAQVLLRLHQGNFDFASAKEDGSDLRIVSADDRTPLKFHIEKWDALVDLVGLVWIDVPDLAPGTQTGFYLYWGNQNATPGGSARETYDPETLLVFHFAEENGLPRDSSAFGNNALTPGRRDASGLIGFGLRFDGTQTVQIAASPTLTLSSGGSATFSIWARPNDEGANGVLYQARGAGSQITLMLRQGVPVGRITNAAGTVEVTGDAGIPAEAWAHVALVVNEGRARIVLDGRPGVDAAIQLPSIAGVATLGGPLPTPLAGPAPAPVPPPAAAPPAATQAAPGAPAASPTPASPTSAAPTPVAPAPEPPLPGFQGLIDEFQIAKTARPLGFLQIAHASQGGSAKLLTLEVIEEGSVFGSGPFAVIVKNTPLDAWIVIVLCIFLLIAAMVITWRKVALLNRMQSANAAFLVEFDALVGEGLSRRTLGAIQDGKRPILARSPLYQVYRTVSREVEGRLATRGPMLSDPALTAIRSTLGSQITRIAQRLSSGMVVLTIAISGGPFLGLLGTVIGVMLVFGAVAAAGDVNVNAIAPGIAAALLATVAGLAVAIPALFAYNYLQLRIKDMTGTVIGFSEELVGRVGEAFSRPPEPANDLAQFNPALLREAGE